MEKVKTIKSADIAENSSALFETNTQQIALFNCEGQFYGQFRGSRTKSDLGPGPNPIWVWDQIRFGSGTKSDLGLGPTPPHPPHIIIILRHLKFSSSSIEKVNVENASCKPTASQP